MGSDSSAFVSPLFRVAPKRIGFQLISIFMDYGSRSANDTMTNSFADFIDAFYIKSRRERLGPEIPEYSRLGFAGNSGLG